mmetsp:Transcript_43022/g.78213  ORF Transcript_43022/g.78213 Transcript_43022/m.78213 type:complete len:210 (+) Transcript_43022:40-669(+)
MLTPAREPCFPAADRKPAPQAKSNPTSLAVCEHGSEPHPDDARTVGTCEIQLPLAEPLPAFGSAPPVPWPSASPSPLSLASKQQWRNSAPEPAGSCRRKQAGCQTPAALHGPCSPLLHFPMVPPACLYSLAAQYCQREHASRLGSAHPLAVVHIAKPAAHSWSQAPIAPVPAEHCLWSTELETSLAGAQRPGEHRTAPWASLAVVAPVA